MAIIKCHECNKDISSTAVACPNCGAKPKKKTTIGEFLSVCIGIVLAFVIFGGGSKTQDQTMNSPKPVNSIQQPTSTLATQNTTQNKVTVNSELSAEDLQFSKDTYTGFVKGKIVNTTGKKITYAQVEINLFDETGAQVGSTMANINNFEPNAVWKFEAPVLVQSAVSAKIAGITKW